MTQKPSPKIRVVADADVIEELSEILEENDAVVLSRGPVEDPGRFAFDFATVSAVVTLARFLLFTDPVIPELYRRLRRRTDRTKIVIEGPHGRVEIGSNGRPLEEAEIRAAVESVAGMRPASEEEA